MLQATRDENKVPLTFSTDADYWVPGKTRGEVAIEFIETWKAAGIPAADILRAMTINGYKVSETETTRGPIKVGMFADLIAVPGNPLERIDALRDVQFVMQERDGVQGQGRDDARGVLQRRTGERVERALSHQRAASELPASYQLPVPGPPFHGPRISLVTQPP